MMTHGHPATSMSNEIDYVYINEIREIWLQAHSERVLVGPNTVAFDAHSELPVVLPDLLEPSPRGSRGSQQ